MRIFVTRWFARYARRERIGEDRLLEAVERAGRGNVDADLGGGIIKQRVARSGRGRSAGFRVLVAFHCGERAVFLYGFAKKERENIRADELETLREIAAAWFRATDADLDRAVSAGVLREVHHGERN